ncbi:MAG: RsbRD N-terminal domain-containing protein [Coriobacteriales bacterium]|jgi:hypothetical protein|nr:RsbRD N-terminal domain-containing protein [Coriobacteriales bacterium]
MMTATGATKRARADILTKWRQSIDAERGPSPFGAAPATSRFANPTGHLFEQTTELLLDWALSDADVSEAHMALEDICRVRAVQGLSPAQALRFIPDLKAIVRSVREGTQQSEAEHAGLEQLECRIDMLLLQAFDEYALQRERIAEIRIDEIRRLYGRGAQ